MPGRALIPIVGSKNYVKTNLKQSMISIKYKLAQKKIKSQKINQTQIQVIYPGSILLTYIQSPSHPLEIFLILDFVHPKLTPCTPLDKSPFPNVYNSSYTKKITTPCTTSLQPEVTFVQSFSLSD